MPQHGPRLRGAPGTRGLHYLGTVLAVLALAAAVLLRQPLVLLLAPLLGYGCAWLGHGLVERNRPATFGHPGWSLLGDCRMLALALAGRLAGELERYASGRQSRAP